MFEQLIIDYTKIEAYMLKTVNVGNYRKDDAMCSMFTLQHIGIILTIIGMGCLAFSLKIIDQYEDRKFIKSHTKDGKIPISYSYIRREIIWLGLAFVEVGSLLQW